MYKTHHAWIAAAALSSLTAIVRAEPGPPAGEAEADAAPIVVAPIDVRAAAERDDGPVGLTSGRAADANAARALEEPAFVTVVRVDDRAGETTTVAEVLGRSVGVRIRSIGGLGAFSSLSVRGAASGHTSVFVDGVPLSRLASTTTDLGRFELGSFAELELYRGGVPAELGGAALGGALNLVTRVGPPPDGRRLAASLGAGSFGARHLRARWLDGSADGRHGWHLSAGYHGAAGDFTYFDDRGTNLNPSDDVYRPRDNNGYGQTEAVARYRGRFGDWLVEGGGRTSWKDQELPAPGSAPAASATLDTLDALVDARADKGRFFGHASLTSSAAAYLFGERQRYRDLGGQVGIGVQELDYTTATAGGSWVVRWAAPGAQLWTLGLEGRLDAFTQDDLRAPADMPRRASGSRVGGALLFSDEVAFGDTEAVILQGAVRLDVQRTAPMDGVVGGVGDMELPARTDLYPSPRLSGRVRVTEAVSLKGSGGWYFRAPTVLELFGDRGFVLGNPALRAEVGTSADAGVVIAPLRRLGTFDRLYLELAAFMVRPDNAITWVPVGGFALKPVNLDDARIRGLETTASVRVARTATLSVNHTLLDTRQLSRQPSFDGKRLPYRPRHELYGRLDLARTLGGRLVNAWTDGAYASGNSLDRANISDVPPRLLFGAGLRAELTRHLLAGLEVKNLTDNRVEWVALDPPPRPDLTQVPRAISDFVGYPLPGRAVYLTLEWKQ